MPTTEELQELIRLINRVNEGGGDFADVEECVSYEESLLQKYPTLTVKDLHKMAKL